MMPYFVVSRKKNEFPKQTFIVKAFLGFIPHSRNITSTGEF